MATDFGNILPGIAAGAFVEAHHYLIDRGSTTYNAAKVQGVRWLGGKVFAPEHGLCNGNSFGPAKAYDAYGSLTGRGGYGYNGIGSGMVQHGAKVRWAAGMWCG